MCDTRKSSPTHSTSIESADCGYFVPQSVEDEHGVLLKANGSVWTWGDNHNGQLGRAVRNSWTPAQVPGVHDIISVAAGRDFSMALRSDGTVWTWGDNPDGQLGNLTPKGSTRPMFIPWLPHIQAIAAAGTHAMALDSKVNVWTWGSMASRSPQLMPMPVPQLNNVIAIAAGDDHDIVLDRNGTVFVWGDHGAGNLGGHGHLSVFPEPIKELSSDVTGPFRIEAELCCGFSS